MIARGVVPACSQFFVTNCWVLDVCADVSVELSHLAKFACSLARGTVFDNHAHCSAPKVIWELLGPEKVSPCVV